MLFFLFLDHKKTDEQMHKETNKLMFHPLATAGLSSELESYYFLDGDVPLKGHGKGNAKGSDVPLKGHGNAGNAKGSSLGGTIVTMLNAYMGPLDLMLCRFHEDFPYIGNNNPN